MTIPENNSHIAHSERSILNRDTIVKAALDIIDSKGLESLSMRYLAKYLGVSAGALYPYVGSKEELTRALIDEAFGEVDLSIFDCTDWQTSLRSMAIEMRNIFLKHRDLVKLTLGRIPMGPNFAHVLEKMIRCLVDSGLPSHLAFYAGDLLGLYISASVYEQYLQAHQEDDTPTVEESVSAFREFLKSLPQSEFPLVHQASSQDWDLSCDRYTLGIDVILSGLNQTFQNYQNPAQKRQDSPKTGP